MVTTNSDKYQLFIQWLVKQRSVCDVTQAELSERLGKKQSFVSKYENGERRLDIVEFIDICEALDIDPSELITMLTTK